MWQMPLPAPTFVVAIKTVFNATVADYVYDVILAS